MQASNAAKRLLRKRPPFMPAPQSELELMDLVEYLAKRKVAFLSSRDRKCLQVWHNYRRTMIKVGAK